MSRAGAWLKQQHPEGLRGAKGGLPCQGRLSECRHSWKPAREKSDSNAASSVARRGKQEGEALNIPHLARFECEQPRERPRQTISTVLTRVVRIRLRSVGVHVLGLAHHGRLRSRLGCLHEAGVERGYKVGCIVRARQASFLGRCKQKIALGLPYPSIAIDRRATHAG